MNWHKITTIMKIFINVRGPIFRYALWIGFRIIGYSFPDIERFHAIPHRAHEQAYPTHGNPYRALTSCRLDCLPIILSLHRSFVHFHIYQMISCQNKTHNAYKQADCFYANVVDCFWYHVIDCFCAHVVSPPFSIKKKTAV